MDLISYLIEFVLHLDKHLPEIIAQYGFWIYGLIFLIIFCETGLVITPFLPGDSLLFATGAIIARPESNLNILLMFLAVSFAAILGDFANYHIGKYIGSGIFNRGSRFIKKQHLDRTRAFYAEHGARTIIYARFIPIIRTFAPFVAGVGEMAYSKFFLYNITGGILWALLFLGAGFLFGNIPFVEKNFSLVILSIIILSLIPVIIELIKNRKK